MGIVDEDIARVREASDIVAVVSEHVALKRVGRQFTGLCPFHQENSGSFSVSGEKGAYYCFGCGAKGDAITFVREIEHLDFVAAVEKLAAKAGVTLRYTDQHEGEGRKQKAKLVEAVARAVEWYHERLLSAPDAGRARAYLRERGLTGDEVRTYQIGWAPDAWDELVRALKLPEQVAVDAGLAFRNKAGRLTDFFRGRLLFPIYDAGGDAIGFGGRILPGADGPKYKNSAESRIYAKSRVLYGLNWHKGAIVRADEAIVCEGYTDVIGFAAAGLPRAVATCGTSLTEDHFRVLKSYAHRIVLAFDADAAGQNAAERFYQWERQYEIDVAVAALPAGVDPADLARSDPEALAAAVAEAVPFLGFRVERVLQAANLSTPEGRARAAEAALGVVREHPSELVRDQYLMEIASRTRTDPEQLRAGLRSGRLGPSRQAAHPSPGRPAAAGRPARPPRPARESAELEALRLLLARPDDIADQLCDVLFGDAVTLDAYRALVAAPTFLAAVDAAEPATAELLSRLVVEDSEAEPGDVVELLIQGAASRELRALEAAARTAADPLDYAPDITWVKLRLEELRERGSGEEAAEQLLAWLTQPNEEFA